MKAKEKIEEIFNSIQNCHPSREDDIKAKESIKYLAEIIDDIRSDIEYLSGKNKPKWAKGSPYDLNTHPRKRKN
jgi:hypothetical protein